MEQRDCQCTPCNMLYIATKGTSFKILIIITADITWTLEKLSNEGPKSTHVNTYMYVIKGAIILQGYNIRL